MKFERNGLSQMASTFTELLGPHVGGGLGRGGVGGRRSEETKSFIGQLEAKAISEPPTPG